MKKVCLLRTASVRVFNGGRSAVGVEADVGLLLDSFHHALRMGTIVNEVSHIPHKQQTETNPQPLLPLGDCEMGDGVGWVAKTYSFVRNLELLEDSYDLPWVRSGVRCTR